MAWTWAALMPHPPIIVPEVGRGREREAAETLKGTEAICAKIREINSTEPPEVLLLLSPHEPYTPNALYINTAERPSGSLVRFGAPMVRSNLTTAKEDIDELIPVLSKAGITLGVGALDDITADHASQVPLYYLAPTFPEGKLPLVILANPSGLGLEQAVKMGKALREFGNNKRWALLASGDLSHRLKHGAPSGYHEDGAVFDQAIVEALKKGDPAILTGLPPSVLQNAGECGLRPSLILLGLCQAPLEVFSYEGPFGVGYCNALWNPKATGCEMPAQPPAAEELKTETTQNTQPRIGKISLIPHQAKEKQSLQSQAAMLALKHAADPSLRDERKSRPEPDHPYAHLARMTITARLEGRPTPTSDDLASLSADPDIWNVHKGCFVSIKNKDGSLRGCIGTFGPTQPTLAREIMVNAVAASTRDPRFPAMKAEELDNVVISVDVLNQPELVEEGMELDPLVWGVIVSKGARRGLLLPDLPTVTTVEQQISIAAQKGGVSDLTDAEVRRFTISRYLESENGEEQ